MEFKRLHELEKQEASVVLAGFESNEASSVEKGLALVRQAQLYGLNIKDYLRAAVKPKCDGLDGYETALLHLKLPVKDDYANNVTIQLASDTFYSQPASRILFPEVVLDLVKWKTPQDQVVSVEGMISQTRTVQGTNQMIWMELDDAKTDLHQRPVAEGTPVTITKIGSSQRAVNFFKVGKGYEFTYEFQRRAAIDILTPFVNRLNRQFEIDQVGHATSLLINGDGVAGAITAKAETDYGGTNGILDYKSLLKWISARAIAGYPIDTIIGNYDAYVEFLFLFTPDGKGTTNAGEVIAERNGIRIQTAGAIPFLNRTINFVIAPTMPASTVVGITKGETLEKLVEAGSDISELERSITKQTITFVRTQNIGFNLATPAARESFSWA